jgi:hypothetical protein
MFQQSSCVKETMSLKRFFGTGTGGDDGGLRIFGHCNEGELATCKIAAQE